jgi:hypothetical protein
MRSSSKSKSNSPSKAGSFPNVSPEVAAEIAYLMRTPGALSEGMQRPGGGGHYDPNQPRVPAGDPKGGQFASKGYRGGASDHDARVAQFAQLGPGAAHAQPLPFDQELGFMSPAQNRDGRAGFVQEDKNPRRDRRNDFQSDDGRYRFLSMGPYAHEKIPSGDRWVISWTTYAYDRSAGAYAIISATPARPIVITSSNHRLSIRPVFSQPR